ncbi:MAG: hypothetical protein PF542_06465 [Nanoarchaeota archaeon]|jgi:hypothetical protein|nr:hypothetical protein [Nanoarchaeota archaeon]
MRIKYITFFCFVLFVSFGSAVTLSMSPPQIDFVGRTGEVICQNISIEVDGIETLVGQTKWAEEGFNERKLLRHSLAGEDLKLFVDFPESVEIDEVREVEVCIEGKSTGAFHGLLLYKVENKPVQVGIWINVSLSKGSAVNRLTGKAIEVSDDKGGSWFVLTVVLLVVLGGLVFLSRRQK